MDWVRFLDENNINYVTRGPNTKRGEISIKCPMCGDDDPSEHMGINLQSGFWGCHRDQSHRGKSLKFLIRRILGCSTSHAEYIIDHYGRSDPDTLDAALSSLQGEDRDELRHNIIKQSVEPEFEDFSEIRARGVTKRFFIYLQSRGYGNPYEIIRKYDLRCALVGRYKDRIVIPVRLNGELLGWTGRAITKTTQAPRYLTSNQDIKSSILNYDDLREGGDRLFVVEGPFDAIRLDSYCHPKSGAPHLYKASCTFGTSVVVSQVALLRTLVKKFRETWVLFDNGADQSSQNLAEWIGARSAYLPHNVKDPGDMDERMLCDLADPEFDGFVYGGTQNTLFYRTRSAIFHTPNLKVRP